MTNDKSIKTLLAVMAALTMGLGLIGCSDDDNPADPGLGDGAKLRVVHASPDAPEVDVYAEGVATPLITGLGYTETSVYLDLDPGTYNIQLRAAGAAPTSEPAYETGELTVPADAVITAVAVGLLGSTAGADAFRVLPLVEDFTAPGAGQAAVRIVHGAADAPTVAIDVGNDGTPEITGFARFAETGPAGVALPAGSPLAVGIWAGSPLARVTAFTTPALPEAEIFLIATGLLGSSPGAQDGFGLLAVGPAGTVGLIRQNPVVFVLHASPDAPAVDVFVGGTETELVDDLSFGELSPPVQVPPASYSLDVKVAAGGALAATVATPALVAGERYLAVASGFVAAEGIEFTLLAYADDFGNAADPLVRVVHASPDAPAVDVGVWNGTTLTPVGAYTDLAFGEASAAAGTALPAAAFTVGVAATGTGTPAATFDLAPTAGLRAFAVAGGSLAGTGQSFRLMLVVASAYPWQVVEVLPNP